MKISIVGKLIDCVNTKSDDGKKDYFSLVVYNGGQSCRVGVPIDVYTSFTNKIDEQIVLDDVNFYSEGRTSLYIK